MRRRPPWRASRSRSSRGIRGTEHVRTATCLQNVGGQFVPWRTTTVHGRAFVDRGDDEEPRRSLRAAGDRGTPGGAGTFAFLPGTRQEIELLRTRLRRRRRRGRRWCCHGSRASSRRARSAPAAPRHARLRAGRPTVGTPDAGGAGTPTGPHHEAAAEGLGSNALGRPRSRGCERAEGRARGRRHPHCARGVVPRPGCVRGWWCAPRAKPLGGSCSPSRA